MRNLSLTVFLCCMLGSCGFPQKEDKNADSELFKEYCLMNATETFDFRLPDGLVLKDVNANRFCADTLFGDDRLVLRIKDAFCAECITEELRQIKDLKDDSNVIIMATYSNLRMLKACVNKHEIQVPVYYIPNGPLQEVFSRNDAKGIPYLFILRKDLSCESVFFPSKTFPRFSASYYRTVNEDLNRRRKKEPVFVRTNIDLGNIEYGKTYDVDFKYENKGDKLLVIHEVRHSCGCVVPQWQKEPLQKGESSILTIRFTPKGHGYSIQTAIVYHSQSEYPVKLTVRANVL